MASAVSLVLGLLQHHISQRLTGLTILLAVVLVAAVTAAADCLQEERVRALESSQLDTPVTVVREGRHVSIAARHLVVGDVVLVSAGDVVPADGAVLQVNDLLVSQHQLSGELSSSSSTPKGPRRGQGGDRVGAGGGTGGGGQGGWAAGWVGAGGEVWWASPAVFAGTYVEFGEARMVVLAVGAATYRARRKKEGEGEGRKESSGWGGEPRGRGGGKSVLRVKVGAIGLQLALAGFVAGAVTCGIQMLRFIPCATQQQQCFEESGRVIERGGGGGGEALPPLEFSQMLKFIVQGVAVFVAVVPEGSNLKKNSMFFF